MTILEAAVEVLGRRGEPLSVKDIYEEILRSGLYSFGAKNPRSVLSGTLRKHVKTSPSPKVIEVSNGVYKLS